MNCCDVQGPGCKILYHGDCVGISKSHGKRMEQDNVDFICPVCITVQNTLNSNLTLGDDSTSVSTVNFTSEVIPLATVPTAISGDSTSPVDGVPELPSFTKTSPASFLWNDTT